MEVRPPPFILQGPGRGFPRCRASKSIDSGNKNAGLSEDRRFLRTHHDEHSSGRRLVSCGRSGRVLVLFCLFAINMLLLLGRTASTCGVLHLFLARALELLGGGVNNAGTIFTTITSTSASNTTLYSGCGLFVAAELMELRRKEGQETENDSPEADAGMISSIENTISSDDSDEPEPEAEPRTPRLISLSSSPNEKSDAQGGRAFLQTQDVPRSRIFADQPHSSNLRREDEASYTRPFEGTRNVDPEGAVVSFAREKEAELHDLPADDNGPMLELYLGHSADYDEDDDQQVDQSEQQEVLAHVYSTSLSGKILETEQVQSSALQRGLSPFYDDDFDYGSPEDMDMEFAAAFGRPYEQARDDLLALKRREEEQEREREEAEARRQAERFRRIQEQQQKTLDDTNSESDVLQNDEIIPLAVAKMLQGEGTFAATTDLQCPVEAQAPDGKKQEINQQCLAAGKREVKAEEVVAWYQSSSFFGGVAKNFWEGVKRRIPDLRNIFRSLLEKATWLKDKVKDAGSSFSKFIAKLAFGELSFKRMFRVLTDRLAQTASLSLGVAAQATLFRFVPGVAVPIGDYLHGTVKKMVEKFMNGEPFTFLRELFQNIVGKGLVGSIVPFLVRSALSQVWALVSGAFSKAVELLGEAGKLVSWGIKATGEQLKKLVTHVAHGLATLGKGLQSMAKRLATFLSQKLFNFLENKTPKAAQPAVDNITITSQPSTKVAALPLPPQNDHINGIQQNQNDSGNKDEHEQTDDEKSEAALQHVLADVEGNEKVDTLEVEAVELWQGMDKQVAKLAEEVFKNGVKHDQEEKAEGEMFIKALAPEVPEEVPEKVKKPFLGRIKEKVWDFLVGEESTLRKAIDKTWETGLDVLGWLSTHMARLFSSAVFYAMLFKLAGIVSDLLLNVLHLFHLPPWLTGRVTNDLVETVVVVLGVQFQDKITELLQRVLYDHLPTVAQKFKLFMKSGAEKLRRLLGSVLMTLPHQTLAWLKSRIVKTWTSAWGRISALFGRGTSDAAEGTTSKSTPRRYASAIAETIAGAASKAAREEGHGTEHGVIASTEAELLKHRAGDDEDGSSWTTGSGEIVVKSRGPFSWFRNPIGHMQRNFNDALEKFRVATSRVTDFISRKTKGFMDYVKTVGARSLFASVRTVAEVVLGTVVDYVFPYVFFVLTKICPILGPVEFIVRLLVHQLALQLLYFKRPEGGQKQNAVASAVVGAGAAPASSLLEGTTGERERAKAANSDDDDAAGDESSLLEGTTTSDDDDDDDDAPKEVKELGDTIYGNFFDMAKDHLLKVLNGEALTGKIIKQIQEHLFPGEKNGKKSSFLETTTAADETHQFIPAPLAVTTVDPIVVEPATNKGFLARRLSSSSSEQGSSAENGLESSVHLAVEEIRSAVGEEQKPPHLKTSRSKHQTRKFLSRRRADDVDDLQTDDLDAATTGQVRTLAQSESGDLQAWAGSLLEDGSGAPGGVGKTWDQELAERTVTGDNIKVQEAVENPEALKGLEEKLFGEKVEVDKVKDKEQNPSAGAVAVQSSSALGRFFESMTKNVQSVLDTKFPSASQTAQGDDQDKTAISKIDKNTTPEQARNWLETVVEKVPFMKSIFHFVTHSFHVSICSMVAGAVTKLLVSTFLRFYTPRTTALGLPAALRILIYTFLTSDESGLRHYIDLAILKSWGLGLVQAVARSVLGKLIANMGHVARWGGSAFHKLFSTAVKKLWVSKSAQAGGSPGAGAAASGGG